MPDFETRWKSAVGFRKTSAPLFDLLERAYLELSRDPADAESVRRALEELIVFLTSAEGRTDANCSVTDSFFSRAEQWIPGWGQLPKTLQQVLADLSGALHDTIHAPEIARTFESTPEQLLARLRAM